MRIYRQQVKPNAGQYLVIRKRQQNADMKDFYFGFHTSFLCSENVPKSSHLVAELIMKELGNVKRKI